MASRGCVKSAECIKPSKKEKTAASGKPSNKVLQQPCLCVLYVFVSQLNVLPISRVYSN